MRRDYWADRLLTDDGETWAWSLMVVDPHGVYTEEWPCWKRPTAFAGERAMPPAGAYRLSVAAVVRGRDDLDRLLYHRFRRHRPHGGRRLQLRRRQSLRQLTETLLR